MKKSIHFDSKLTFVLDNPVLLHDKISKIQISKEL